MLLLMLPFFLFSLFKNNIKTLKLKLYFRGFFLCWLFGIKKKKDTFFFCCLKKGRRNNIEQKKHREEESILCNYVYVLNVLENYVGIWGGISACYFPPKLCIWFIAATSPGSIVVFGALKSISTIIKLNLNFH